MAEDLDKLKSAVANHRVRSDIPDETKMLLKRLIETLASYNAGEVPSGEVCLRILRGDFDYNLEVILHYIDRRMAHPDRRQKKLPDRTRDAKEEFKDEF